MSKNWMITIIVVALAIFGYFYSQSGKDKMVPKDTMVKEEVMVKTDDAMVKEDDKMMKESSRYLPFTPAVLAQASSTRRVLYFYASWCSTCIPANADFEKNVSQIPSDVTVIRVNYNDPETDAQEKALAIKYAVTYQHTFVQIDSEGKVLTIWNGGATKELLAKIKK